MATRFRFIPRAGAAFDPRLDQLVDGAEIHVGRAAYCGLRLMRAGVRFDHATLREDGLGLEVEALPGAVLGTLDQPARTARLANFGDSVRIGPCVLTLNPPDGGERIVSVTFDDATPPDGASLDEAALAGRYRRVFDVALPNVRLWAFGLSVAVFALFFILPLVFAPGRVEPGWTTKSGRAEMDAGAENSPFRLASLWNVGRISSAHAAFGTNCASCHEAPFIRVQSSSCLACHQGIGQHADPHLAPLADLTTQRCEACHHEHKGATLATRDDQSDCVSCHGDIKSIAPSTSLHDVHDFGTDHPQFAPALVQDAVLRTTRRFERGDQAAADHANLRFTHATHLKLDKLRTAMASGGMANGGCGVCHVPAPGGLVFKPVEFAQSCADCHTLAFEPRHPDWRLPHGHPEEVASRIAGYYAQAALAGETFPAPRSDLFAKPGAPLPPPAPEGTALVSWQTAAAMMSSIARSDCGQCHVTTPPELGEPESAWKVLPVFLPDHYLTKARFNHEKHATVSCQDCHAALTSNGGVSSLLPGIETCRECHAGAAGASQRVASRCVSCHVFHDSTRPIIDPRSSVLTQERRFSAFSQMETR